jgi:Protein of unknown function (DUF3047)
MKTLAKLAFLLLAATPAWGEPCSTRLTAKYPATAFRVVREKSGPVNYYRVVEDSKLSFVHAEYKPPMETTVLGIAVANADRSRATRLSWSWRALTLPRGGDECTDGKGDSAAVLYVTWKRGLRWYTLKYAWSAVGTKGKVCDSKRNPFVAQDTIILESGGPLGTWKNEELDLRAEFRRHFEGGDPAAAVPDLIGVGIMTDGDQTQSESAADYANFTLSADGDCKK